MKTNAGNAMYDSRGVDAGWAGAGICRPRQRATAFSNRPNQLPRNLPTSGEIGNPSPMRLDAPVPRYSDCPGRKHPALPRLRVLFLLLSSLLCHLPSTASAVTRYVSLSGGNIPPYTNWAMAATNIQYAIDVCSSGDVVIVTNGTYNTGGRVVYGAMTNRVAITNAIVVRSVNGPTLTIIQGRGPVGSNAIRCAFVGNNATLSGVALVNGATRSMGDVGRERCGGGVWLATNALLTNCTLTGNSASDSGGGSYGGILHNCMLTSNYSYSGGACAYGTLNTCAIMHNASYANGGGSYRSTLFDCALLHNVAGNLGGGSSEGMLNKCVLHGNSASSGGGSYRATLINCALTANAAASYGGGAYQGVQHNCTIAGNSSSNAGGGTYYSTQYNCVVYFNVAPTGANYTGSSFRDSCTTPSPAGTGNITNDPQLAGTTRLSVFSPCIGAGSVDNVSGSDIDGEPWRSPPAMGCDEVHVGSLTGPLGVAIGASQSNVTPGCIIDFTAFVTGLATMSTWNYGDGTVTSNRPYAGHAFTATGQYSVVLTVANDSHPTGVSATATIYVVSEIVHYVNQSNATPAWPFASWATAATNIQDAIDAASVPGALTSVLVHDGVYETGGRAINGGVTNRVAITKAIAVRSVNGPAVTIIKGKGPIGNDAVRCVYAGSNAILSGFTLVNGHTQGAGGDGVGGGVWCATNAIISNCVFSHNAAHFSGGGAYYGTLLNCTLTGNTSYVSGGGSYRSTLQNCHLSGNTAATGGGAYNGVLNNCALYDNSAREGGAAYSATLNNCTVCGNVATNTGGGIYYGTARNSIIYFNAAPNGENHYMSTCSHCCTTPLPGGGGNIASDPMLSGTMHISVASPCIGAGAVSNTVGVDIDGEAWRFPPAMGCDEVVPGSVTGSVGAFIVASYTNVTPGFPVDLTAYITGRVTGSHWSFGDGATASNRLYISHAYSATGLYAVVLTAVNEDHPNGVTTGIVISVVSQPVHYVGIHSGTPEAPFGTWDTAATNIQDAIDVSSVAGSLILVSNGVYDAGGRVLGGSSTVTNRVAIQKPVVVRSVNGPSVTVIRGRADAIATNGNGAVRCAYVGARATLAGFTLDNGHTRSAGANETEQSGGGVWCEPSATVSNCVLSCNSARAYGGGSYNGRLINCIVTENAAFRGGGSYSGWLTGCVIVSNAAGDQGGGTYEGLVENCTLVRNTAVSLGGGAFNGMLRNCVVYFNEAPVGSNYYGAAISYSCTVPFNFGAGNITGNPMFSNPDGGVYSLGPESPCIDTGQYQDWHTNAHDISGRPRLLQGCVDMGAYEFSFEARLRGIVAGAWVATNAEMRAGSVSTIAPYAGARVTVTNVPTSAVDWVLVSVRASPTSSPAASVSAFLLDDGRIVGADGGSNVYIEAKGNLYGVLQHRNHLAVMSAVPVFTSRVVNFDFSADPNLLWGGTNAVVQVSTDTWGMIPGDADGDGAVRPVDEAIRGSQSQ